MNEIVNIFKSRPFLAVSLSSLLLLVCCYHFVYRLGLNLSILVGISAITLFISLSKEMLAFFKESLENKRKNLIVLCILFFSGLGLVLNFENIKEIGFFVILFFSFYLIFRNENRILNNFIFNLVIFSGILMSLGVFIGIFESIFLSSELFHHVYDGYAYFGEKSVYSGFGFNHNYSAYIIIIAQSFLFLSTSIFNRKLKLFLTLFFLAALLISAAKIAFLFLDLLAINFFSKQIGKKKFLIFGLISFYLFLTHIVIAISNGYEIGSDHYQELLFSFLGVDFILGFYGYSKELYFISLYENLFLPISLEDIRQALNYDPHFLFYSFIILGGFPLCLSILAFLTHGIYKNIIIIEKRIHVYFYCGLLAIISESFLWDAYDSPFFWIIIIYAITFSKDHLITKEGSRAIT